MPVVSGRVVYASDGSETCYIGDQIVSREEFDARFPPKPLGVPLQGHTSACWPMRSEALAVHPDQVAEGNARNKKAGVGARYEAGTGICVIPDRGDRKKLLKVEGLHDNHGGYGD